MHSSLSVEEVLLALSGGLIAGSINTLAGNGSAITLPILMWVLGLPPHLANGTNRVGILIQTSLSYLVFRRHKMIRAEDYGLYIYPTLIGALLGVMIAVYIPAEAFVRTFGLLMLLLLAVIAFRTSIRAWSAPKRVSAGKLKLYSFILGVYGGFIQMGMGIFFLLLLMGLTRRNIIEANAVKVTAVAVYTAVILVIFVAYGMVDWQMGLLMAVGQGMGGYWTARWATRHPAASTWAFRILILSMGLSAWKALTG